MSQEETINWESYSWRKKFIWGSYHPKTPYMWYSPDCSYLHEGELHLNCIRQEKLLRTQPPVSATYGVGMVESIETFGYGTFTANIQCPFGKNLWPAFWLTGKEDWPPEIDIFECWNNYKSWDILKLRKRWYKSGIIAGSGTKTVPIKKPWVFPASKLWKINGWNLMPKNINDRFYEWKLIYGPDKTEVYMDSKLIYKADEDRVKHESFQGNPPMSVVFGLLVGQGSQDVGTQNPLRIKSFDYKPL